jgi:hypothetical protein
MEEIVREVIERGRPLVDVWEELDTEERRTLRTLAAYQANYEAEQKRLHSPAWRTARRLLRSFLSTEQRRQMDCPHRGIDVVGSAGGLYRLFPNTGAVNGMERHGSRLFTVATYCWHDDGRELPSPDVAVAALLLISCNEPAFLAEAHVTPHVPHEWWDGDWRRRVFARQREGRGPEPQIFACQIDESVA